MINTYVLKLGNLINEKLITVLAILLSVSAILYSYFHGYIIAYGDAESHLNIAKRVVHGITPGFSQLGGIWLPLPHLMMTPFVHFNFLWRTGIAGSIVSGFSFIISCIFLYKITWLVTKNTLASFITFLIFACNPNVLYMQTTPMTELPLIMFFILSSYFFFKFLQQDTDLLSLILSGIFGFFASLSRYDGWFLILVEAGVLFSHFLFKKRDRGKTEGMVILFCTVAFFGIFLWMAWNFLILGDPLYFTNSPFSAKSQQQGFLARGQLPAYNNIFMSFAYYSWTSASNIGLLITIVALGGIAYFLCKEMNKEKLLISVVLLVPFFFYVITLYIGQSIIFILPLTPADFPWHLFNVRYGAMMIPVAAIFSGILVSFSQRFIKIGVIVLFIVQTALFTSGYAKNITLEDGIHGLSRAKTTGAEDWFVKHYNGGLVLLDDYVRPLSVIRANIPMENTIYVGNKPYWEKSLEQPDKYATWVVMKKDDSVWKHLYDNPNTRGRLYKYFQKVYTTPDFMIFRKNTPLASK